MPQHQSAKKRVRQNKVRRERNRRQRAKVRTMMKKLRATEEKEAAAAMLPNVKAALDRLASKGIIHQNKAANYKSKLERHVNAL